MGEDDEEPLRGGNVSGAVRVGDTVRRRTGPWTPAVHGLLAHLAAAGVPAVPRVHGIDEAGREILDFLPGEVVDGRADVLDDDRLAAVGRWLRTFHDAVADYRPAPQRWYFAVREVGEGEVICHHDVSPSNLAFDGPALVGVFDWEMAGPGDPLGDVAYFAWNALPLLRPVDDLDDAALARRLVLLAESYGRVAPADLLDLAIARMRTATDRIEAGQRAGDEGMLALGRAAGEPAATRSRIAAAERRLPAIHAALAAAG